MTSTDALFTRFEVLFEKYLDSKQFLFLTLERLGIEQANLRQIFCYAWDEGLPSRQMLLEVLQITYPPGTNEFWGSPTALEDHVLASFALALEELKFSEHKDTSMPQEPHQKAKLGRKANPKVAMRRKIVGNQIREKEDFGDEDKLQLLLQELDRKEIPPPEDIDRLSSFTGSWEGLLKEPGTLARVVKVLNRDRWSRKKAT